MQVPLDWHKSSLCQTGECVEIAAQSGTVIMRKSTQPDAGYVYFTPEEFGSFLMGAKAGEFDLAR
jgi:hypothetical protein